MAILKPLFTLLLTGLLLNCFAQQKMPLRPDASSIVVDSTGHQYTYEEWLKLVYGGLYQIKLKSRNDSTFLLTRLTMDEIIARSARLPKPKESNFFTTGGYITSFSDRDINGNKIDLDKLKGKTIVLNFFFIGCKPCREEMPALNMLVDYYKDNKDVVFIAVALDSKSDLKKFLKTTPFAYPIIADGRSIAQNYNINLYPTNVVINKDGVILFHSSGGSSANISWIAKIVRASALTPASGTN